MKRVSVFVLALVIMISSIPISAYGIENSGESTAIYVEYADFCKNESYYWDQVENRNVLVFIHLDEVAKKELRNKPDGGETLAKANGARGLSRPTSIWDVSTKGTYTIAHSFAYSGNLYTAYKFTGEKHYGIKIYNWSQENAVTIYRHGGVITLDTISNYTLDPNYCVIGSVFFDYASYEFYLEFTAPVDDISGYVGEFNTIKNM